MSAVFPQKPFLSQRKYTFGIPLVSKSELFETVFIRYHSKICVPKCQEISRKSPCFSIVFQENQKNILHSLKNSSKNRLKSFSEFFLQEKFVVKLRVSKSSLFETVLNHIERLSNLAGRLLVFEIGMEAHAESAENSQIAQCIMQPFSPLPDRRPANSCHKSRIWKNCR